MDRPHHEAAGYLHGFTPEETQRLRRQARILEPRTHEGLPFHRSKELLEVGCGVGAQTEILLRRFPDLRVTGLDSSAPNLEAARAHLAGMGWLEGRYTFVEGMAGAMPFERDQFDAAYLCWILEHVADPERVLGEVRRVLRPGSQVVVTEVQNASFFLAPYSPHTLAYWAAFNDHQYELGGDPFIGARLGNLLLRTGYRDIRTELRPIHLDNRWPGERGEFLAYWSDLLLSGAPGLLEAGKVTAETVEGMRDELAAVRHDPDAVFVYSFVQARARVD